MTLDKGSDGELINDAEKIGVEATSLATEFVINVLKTIAGQGADDLDLAEPKDEPNYNQIDVLAWDTPCSPLHMANVLGLPQDKKLFQ